jgi:acyl dehydratase
MTRYRGEWKQLGNTSADSAGSIHDDDKARELGFRGALVPGSVVASAAIPLIYERFGPDWMQGGWFSFAFAAPVYSAEQVQAQGEDGEAEFELRVATRDSRLCCSGQAGLGFVQPWCIDRVPDSEVFPELDVGFAFPEVDIIITEEDVVPMLDAAGDQSRWYRTESPWGGRVAPPEQILPIALQTMRGTRLPLPGKKGPGIWARHHISIREPLRFAEPYRFTQWLVDKGRSGRTLFVEYEFAVRGPSGIVVRGGHRGKWIAQ